MANGTRDRLNRLADVIVPEAVEWVKELQAYRMYQGKDPEYFRKARIGIGVVGGAIRLLATVENARTNDAVEARLRIGDGAGAYAGAPRQIEAAKGEREA